MRLYKQVSLYFFSYAINAALSFGTVSLLTHYLTTYDYGIINLYSSFLIFLMPFISGGIMYPLSVEFFKGKPESYRHFFSNAQVIPLISVGVITIACFLLQQPLSEFLKVPHAWIWILPLFTWTVMINETVMLISRNKSRPVQFAFFSIGKNGLEIILTILLVIGLHWSWQGRLLAAFMAPTLLAVFSIYLFYRWNLLGKTGSLKSIKAIFLLSIPFIFERLSIFVMGYSDKFFINKFDSKGTSEVGLYGLGSQIASIVFIVIVSLSSAYHPHLFKKMSEGLAGKLHKSTLWFIGAVAITVTGVFICLPFLFKFFIGPNFQSAQQYAYMLTGGYFMWGIYNAFIGYLLYLSKNRQIFYISVSGTIISLSLNSFMVPHYGATGAAVTSIITYTFMAAFCFFYVRKYFLLNTGGPSV